MRKPQTPPQSALYHSTHTLLQDSAATSPELQQPPASQRPTTAPKPVIDLKHIRQNPELYAQNCLDRNYKAAAAYPARINELFSEWHAKQREGRGLRERGNLLRRQLANPGSSCDDADEEAAGFRSMSREQLLEEARAVKAQLSTIEDAEAALTAEMQRLALAIPNLTSDTTPRGHEPRVLSYINDHPEPGPAPSDRVWRSHAHVGAELGILDFAGAATASGWGWYYLLDEAAQLEQALVNYALAVATRAGWRQVSPPSMVYSHIAGACGFQPRDVNGETQIYTIAQPDDDAARGKPQLCMAGTAEIPLAGMKADTTLDESDLPMKRVAASRCYRAEAGARGGETKGLYRVHEFTKVELFAWTPPRRGRNRRDLRGDGRPANRAVGVTGPALPRPRNAHRRPGRLRDPQVRYRGLLSVAPRAQRRLGRGHQRQHLHRLPDPPARHAPEVGWQAGLPVDRQRDRDGCATGSGCHLGEWVGRERKVGRYS